ncbi:MAG: hypothetical protein JOY80_06560 [Candidatus Dormibacteraeota bacterium]|nr:hypothetical protein [Candidatus Dormibacteraeota bacterium]
MLLVNYLYQQHPATSPTATTGSAATTKVVVATADLKAGDQLSTANVGLTDYPSSALPASTSYYTDVSKLLSPPQYTSSALPKGTLILQSLLVATADTGPTVTQPPIQINNASDVAISIPYGEQNGAGGYIQPEDHIDIIVADSSGTEHYAFQDVRVIKVGGRGEQGTTTASTGAANLLLIELPREQAATLAYLEDHGATIRYAIRPHDEYGKGNLPNSSAVSGSNWNSFLDG